MKCRLVYYNSPKKPYIEPNTLPEMHFIYEIIFSKINNMLLKDVLQLICDAGYFGAANSVLCLKKSPDNDLL